MIPRFEVLDSILFNPLVVHNPIPPNQIVICANNWKKGPPSPRRANCGRGLGSRNAEKHVFLVQSPTK